jgi:thiaminase/transcriptional activator TenA
VTFLNLNLNLDLNLNQQRPIAELLRAHGPAWQAATRHPFLDGVREGWLPPAAFAAWLIQDYLFVADLIRFQALVLARAPRHAQAVLASGLVGLEAELGWFEDQAAAGGLALTAQRETATQDYQAALDRLAGRPVAVALAALWAIERAYLDAWRSAQPGAPRYAEFVAHWTSPPFAEYVAGLERAATVALGACGDDEQREAELAVLDVARLERAFWDLAWTDRRR